MRVLHRQQNLQKQRKPGTNRQLALVAILIDRNAFNVLQHQEGPPSFG